MNRQKIFNENGAVLVTGLIFLLFLTVIGTTALTTTTNDMTISSNYKSVKEAFYNSEAGVQLAVTAIENGIKAGTFTMPTAASPTVNLQTALAGSIPSGFDFTLGNLEYITENQYRISSVGNGGTHGAVATVRANIRKGSGFEFAAFGDELVDANSSAGFYSYSSDEYSTSAYPINTADSSHDGDIGSNGELNLDSVTVDGDVKLGYGKNGTDPAAQTYNGTPDHLR